MSDPAGRLKIRLQRRSPGLVCSIESTRPVSAATLFAGRPSGQTATMLPMLYSICAKAQAFACVGALESADGVEAPPAVWRSRRLSVQLETIREHLWRMLLDWPRLAGEPAERNGMSTLVRRLGALFELADPEGTLFRPGARETEVPERPWALETAELEVLVSELIFGCPADAWLDRVQDAGTLDDWATSAVTRPAQLIHATLTAEEADIGGSEVDPLPDIPANELAERLLSDGWKDFVAQPTWAGHPRETSPFTRRSGTYLIQQLRSAFGNGLLPRLAAQLVEVAELTTAIRHGTLSDQDGAMSACASSGHGAGIGCAEAARGRLTHLAQTDRGQVLAYRILAPTEWNFHPDGALARGLSGLTDGDDADLTRRAELLVMATDPCVAYDLSIDSGTP